MADATETEIVAGLPGLPAALDEIADYIDICIKAAVGEEHAHQSFILLVKGLCSVRSDLVSIAAETEDDLLHLDMVPTLPVAQPSSRGGSSSRPR